MLDKLEKLEIRMEELNTELNSGELDFNSSKYLNLIKEHSSLEKTVVIYRQYKEITKTLKETEDLIQETEDKELEELANEELNNLLLQQENIIKDLKVALFPKDPNSNKNCIIEIRAGTGGEEAGLFAADLYRMYIKFAEKNKWKTELLSSNQTEVGGFKEVIFSAAGEEVYDKLKYETGAHRVQRIPQTESGGRIHTSAVTVAILPEAEEAEININPNELRIDVYRSSGPGGQSVNTTDSAVRITHEPTGIVVQCQDEKSQHKNKAKALRVLRARLQEKIISEQMKDIAEERKHQIGSGDRSERIRTYNFPQNRVTDHRINLTLHNKLTNVLNGELQELTKSLTSLEKENILKIVDV